MQPGSTNMDADSVFEHLRLTEDTLGSIIRYLDQKTVFKLALSCSLFNGGFLFDYLEQVELTTEAWNLKRISQLQQHHKRVQSLKKISRMTSISDAMKDLIQTIMPKIRGSLRLFCDPNESPCFTAHVNRQNIHSIFIEIASDSLKINQSGTELSEWLAAGFPNVRHLTLYLYGTVEVDHILPAIHQGFAVLERLEIVCGYAANFVETSNDKISAQIASICAKNASTINYIDLTGTQFQNAIPEALQYTPELRDFNALQNRCMELFGVPLSNLKIIQCSLWDLIMGGMLEGTDGLKNVYNEYDALFELCFPSTNSKIDILKQLCKTFRLKLDNPADAAWIAQKTLQIRCTPTDEFKNLLSSITTITTRLNNDATNGYLPALREALKAL